MVKNIAQVSRWKMVPNLKSDKGGFLSWWKKYIATCILLVVTKRTCYKEREGKNR